MDEVMISIIIPVFNAELYICECLDCLLSQCYDSYEIICIDDGSTDNSNALLRRYSQINRHIKVLMQDNMGAGSARNLGIAEARGKYLLFLDIDDIFEKNLLSVTVQKAEENDADVVIFNADKFDAVTGKINDKWRAIKYIPNNGSLFSAEKICDSVFNFTVPAPWNKLFRRDFIERIGVRFQEIRSTNDLMFVYASLCNSKKMVILDEILVHYRTNNQLSIQGRKRGGGEEAFCALMELKNYLEMHGKYAMYRKSYVYMACNIIVYTLARIEIEEFERLATNLNAKGYIAEILTASLHSFDFKSEERIIIYGAGIQAHALVRGMQKILKLDIKKLDIVVTSLADNGGQVEGIPINIIDNIAGKNNEIIMICAENQKSKHEMRKKAEERGFKNIIYVTDVDIVKMIFQIG